MHAQCTQQRLHFPVLLPALPHFQIPITSTRLRPKLLVHHTCTWTSLRSLFSLARCLPSLENACITIDSSFQSSWLAPFCHRLIFFCSLFCFSSSSSRRMSSKSSCRPRRALHTQQYVKVTFWPQAIDLTLTKLFKQTKQKTNRCHNHFTIFLRTWSSCVC